MTTATHQPQPFATPIAIETAKRVLSTDLIRTECWDDNGIIRSIFRSDRRDQAGYAALRYRANGEPVLGRWTEAGAFVAIKTAMTAAQIKNLNDQFDEAVQAGEGPYTAIRRIATSHGLELVKLDRHSCALFEGQDGARVNAWFDNASEFGFDDQIEWSV